MKLNGAGQSDKQLFEQKKRGNTLKKTQNGRRTGQSAQISEEIYLSSLQCLV
jgi:hypothetical protein